MKLEVQSYKGRRSEESI